MIYFRHLGEDLYKATGDYNGVEFRANIRAFGETADILSMYRMVRPEGKTSYWREIPLTSMHLLKAAIQREFRKQSRNFNGS